MLFKQTPNLKKSARVLLQVLLQVLQKGYIASHPAIQDKVDQLGQSPPRLLVIVNCHSWTVWFLLIQYENGPNRIIGH